MNNIEYKTKKKEMVDYKNGDLFMDSQTNLYILYHDGKYWHLVNLSDGTNWCTPYEDIRDTLKRKDIRYLGSDFNITIE